VQRTFTTFLATFYPKDSRDCKVEEKGREERHETAVEWILLLCSGEKRRITDNM
jgi:hypothetical protein